MDDSLKSRFISGAFWVSILTTGALFLGFGRSWLLARIDGSGELLGIFATFFIFVNLAISVGLFGGNTALSSFIPKIQSEEKEKGFLKVYLLITLLWWFVALIILISFPSVFQLFAGRGLEPGSVVSLISLGTVVVLGQVFILNFQGHLRYREAAILMNLQPYVLTFVILLAYLFIAEAFRVHADTWLLFLFIGVNALVLVIGFFKSGYFSFFKEKCFVPSGFFRFACIYQFSSLLIFVYGNVDRLFILDRLGVQELGFYFLIMQIALLITFIPTRMGQVMLSTFSRLIAEGKSDSLNAGYNRLCRIVTCFSLGVALFFVLFSREFCLIFGRELASRSDWLIYLSVAACIGALGNINSMIVLSREKMATYLGMNVAIVLTQCVATWAWIGPYGIEGVISARMLASILGQILLFIMVSRLQGSGANCMKEYLVCVASCCAAAFSVLCYNEMILIYRLLIFVGLFAFFLKVNRFTVGEFTDVIPAKLKHIFQKAFHREAV